MRSGIGRNVSFEGVTLHNIYISLSFFSGRCGSLIVHAYMGVPVIQCVKDATNNDPMKTNAMRF